MNEDFLSYVWHFRLYSGQPKLVTGEDLYVENPGTLNRDSGPDFSGSRIRIGKTLWAGNIEIHVKSSDWNLHGHNRDMAYATVILHVVYDHDTDVQLPDGTLLPVFEMKHSIDPNLYTRYLQFMASAVDIPCAHILKKNFPEFSAQWLVSLGLQRLIRKGDELGWLQERVGSDWHELFYVTFCRSFGNKLNDDVFEMLALKTPLSIVRKQLHSVTCLEALFFGQSGLLSECPGSRGNDYIAELRSIYEHIVYTYHCEAIAPGHWKFLRTRPANFPTIRIAQLAALMPGFSDLNPLSVNEIGKWMKEAARIMVSDYWQHHYHFGKKGTKLPGAVGKESLARLVINGLVPPLLRYGQIYRNHDFITSLVEWITVLPPEDNRIIRKWVSLGVRPDSILTSQGLTELYNEYCRGKRCLECRFGHFLLETSRA